MNGLTKGGEGQRGREGREKRGRRKEVGEEKVNKYLINMEMHINELFFFLQKIVISFPLSQRSNMYLLHSFCRLGIL